MDKNEEFNRHVLNFNNRFNNIVSKINNTFAVDLSYSKVKAEKHESYGSFLNSYVDKASSDIQQLLIELIKQLKQRNLLNNLKADVDSAFSWRNIDDVLTDIENKLDKY
ncbi:hypothetical protein [Limosilactobacillus antri]|uniref:hypothetical protein n=1 Tax=Limosilactobacillus antri TaxID=227943 RepID=UPI001F58F0C6|nr:hypothetical protein [Limosilactobacillus antri]